LQQHLTSSAPAGAPSAGSGGGPAPTDPHALTVRECLEVPPLHEGTVVAGAAGLDGRRVRWLTVIEGPVEDFVAPGEFVLSTGLGYGERLHELVTCVGDSQAAALLLAVGPGAPVESVPDDARALGNAYAMPILELPWEIRFADVLRALADRLLSARYAAALDTGDQLPAGFTEALLGRDGLDAIAEALESIIDRPVLVLDAGLAVTASGPLAAARLGVDALAAQPEAAHALDPAPLAGICAARDDDTVRWCDAVEDAGIPAGLCAAATAQGSTLGYVVAVDDEAPREPLIVERHAIAHAAVAVAIETLRRRAVAEAEARARGDFLWELASEESVDAAETATRAALLGYTVTRPYRLMLVQAETAGEDRLDELARRLRRQGALAGLQASRRGDRVLVLVPQDAPRQLHPHALARQGAELAGAGACSWAIPEGSFMLPEIAGGLRHAERALRVGRALEGPGAVADAEALGPFLMLDALAEDEAAQRSAAAVLAPLEAYDDDTARGLVETLETFLRENGNTTAAARALFLNRHSLMYRLRKIEALTGRSLDDHDERFLLELSIRLRRMARA
jgi:purine catabolism regulator